MILQLPYAHKIRCVPPGRTNHVTYDVSGMAPFDVPEVASAGAPESCAHEDVVHRSFGGRSYRRLGTSLDDVQGRKVERRWDVPDVPGGLLARAFEGRGVPARSPFASPSEEDQLREVVGRARRGREVRDLSDDKAEAMGRAQAAWSRRLLVVEGEPWVVAPEPRHMLDKDGTWVVLRAGVEPRAGEVRWTIPFRADRRDEAVAYGRTVAARTKGRRFRDDVRPEEDIEVLSAEHLTFDEADAMAAWIYDPTLERFWNSTGVQGSRFRERLPPDQELDHELVERRRCEGDMGWAVDFLDLPLLHDRVGHAFPGYAHERRSHEEGTLVLHRAWLEMVKPHRLTVDVLDQEAVLAFPSGL